jgi:hypothetical protein
MELWTRLLFWGHLYMYIDKKFGQRQVDVNITFETVQ